MAIAAAGAMGLLCGLWLRVPALLVASGVMVAACLLLAILAKLEPMGTLGGILASLGALQLGYLTGLMLLCVCSRARLGTPATGSSTAIDR
jgi:hypothetical protein